MPPLLLAVVAALGQPLLLGRQRDGGRGRAGGTAGRLRGRRLAGLGGLLVLLVRGLERATVRGAARARAGAVALPVPARRALDRALRTLVLALVTAIGHELAHPGLL